MKKIEVTEYVLGVIMIQQYSLNVVVKKFGKDVEATVKKYTAQLHDMNTFTPVDGSQLIKVEKKGAITSLMFLAEKRYGSINVRACADGCGQREKFEKEDA